MNNKYFELYKNILSNKNELLKFYVDSSSQSSSFVKDNIQFKKKSEKNIKAITIDSFFEEKQVSLNFIRLDVEGSEMKVLKGAKQQIIKYKPQILISIYHKKEDLLDIPEYLLSLNNNYRFKMLPLNCTFIDTVLFAY
jgi:FkbM family methyltransferase